MNDIFAKYITRDHAELIFIMSTAALTEDLELSLNFFLAAKNDFNDDITLDTGVFDAVDNTLRSMLIKVKIEDSKLVRLFNNTRDRLMAERQVKQEKIKRAKG